MVVGCPRHRDAPREWCMDCNPEYYEQKYPRLDPGRNMPGRRHKAGGDTEQGSAALVTPRSGTQREKVLHALRLEDDDGVTDNELHYRFGIGAYPHVAGTRREELIADGWPIVDSGRRRRTKNGTPAIVWVLRR